MLIYAFLLWQMHYYGLSLDVPIERYRIREVHLEWIVFVILFVQIKVSCPDAPWCLPLVQYCSVEKTIPRMPQRAETPLCSCIKM